MISTLVYIFALPLVTGLLAVAAVFPFWKVWSRVKAAHPDLWASKGPFEPERLLRDAALRRSFLDIVALGDRDEGLLQSDPGLVHWCRVAREFWRLAPQTLVSKIAAVALFFALAHLGARLLAYLFIHY